MSEINDIDVDFKVHDGYIAFSAEVVRLALLSPAIFAFFVTLAGEHPSIQNFATLIAPAASSFSWGLTFMAAAVLFGLSHRYCAIDFMCTLVENRRRGVTAEHSPLLLKASTVSIFAAPICLLLGAILLFRAVFKILI